MEVILAAMKPSLLWDYVLAHFGHNHHWLVQGEFIENILAIQPIMVFNMV